MVRTYLHRIELSKVLQNRGSRWMPHHHYTQKKSETSYQPECVSVGKAAELLRAGHKYLDVRTCDEFKAGHVSGSINVPYMFTNLLGMSKNPKFVEEVSSHFEKKDKIVIGCQSGRRSNMAAADLLSAGFTSVIDMAGGYSEWIKHFPQINEMK